MLLLRFSIPRMRCMVIIVVCGAESKYGSSLHLPGVADL